MAFDLPFDDIIEVHGELAFVDASGQRIDRVVHLRPDKDGHFQAVLDTMEWQEERLCRERNPGS